MKRRLTAAAGAAGIEYIGVVRARVFEELRPVLEKHGVRDMVTNEVERRINPFLIMPQAKSIIVSLFPYYTKQGGSISKYAQGYDYHRVIPEKLSGITELLTKNGYSARILCDNSDLNDRYLAYRAGLGFFGRNKLLINEKYGSYVFIGSVITDCPLEEDAPTDKTCLGCGSCIAACPGGALGADGSFCEEKCISYITQKKGTLSAEEAELVKKSGMLWGCDRCQEACPHNRGLSETMLAEFSEGLISDLTLDAELSNREFKRRYADRAFAWRGKAPLERNAALLNEDKL